MDARVPHDWGCWFFLRQFDWHSHFFLYEQM